MVHEHRNNVWIIRAGRNRDREQLFLEKGVISLDLNLHLLDHFGEDLEEFRNLPHDHKQYHLMGDKFRDFDRRFRKEFDEAVKKLDHGKEEQRPEVVKKMRSLNRKLKNFDEEMKQFSETMQKFDEFEKLEFIKEMIIAKLAELDPAVLDKWSGEIFHFVSGMRIYDTVVLPIESEGIAFIGKVRENYKYREGFGDLSHYRRIIWSDDRVPFSNLCPGFSELMDSGSHLILVKGDCRDSILEVASKVYF
ncbi:hypothetical protein [Methanolobus halotolerans]|uniref:Uncharacterized protein n=1 Tax=Methanolobus halotolerans TaxID=2052935 RepID=A0A4E0PVK5_9EURY|nr:hypothetical protein [Methanolobus halotolerans]TGC09169.1 hypothetical protein CUN85_07330 [Methanolobus halotolerans]